MEVGEGWIQLDKPERKDYFPIDLSGAGAELIISRRIA
jgi:hypothetical protein